jgi:hypothetical protein
MDNHIGGIIRSPNLAMKVRNSYCSPCRVAPQIQEETKDRSWAGTPLWGLDDFEQTWTWRS